MFTSPRTRTAAAAIRTERFSPYRKGCGPSFTVRVWDENSRNGHHNEVFFQVKEGRTVVLEGIVGIAPQHCIDSDDAMRSVMVFATLRPGDTDAEFFESYSPAALAFATSHGEALSLAAMDRFGEG